MSSPVPQGSVNDGPWPLLVIPVFDNDDFLELAYFPDGRRVVTGSYWGFVEVWNLENGEQEGTSMKHESDSIHGLAVTRDGKKIISGSKGETVKVWDVESHKLIREWPRSEQYPKIAISPDDRFVAVGSRTVVIYSMEGGQVNQSIDPIVEEDNPHIQCMCMSFSPNGDKLACGVDLDIHVYDVKTGALILGPLEDNNITCVLWSRDGDRLFSCSHKTIRCWNSDTGEQIGHPWTGHTEWIRALSLSPDGSILASASWDKTIRFWDATTGDPVGQYQHDEHVLDVSFSPSGEFVASIDYKKIYLWRVPWWGSVQSQMSLADLGAPHNTVHLAQLSLFHPPPPSSAHPLLNSLAQDPNIDPPDMSATSDEVGLQCMIPDLCLGLDECQRIFDRRLRKLVELATSKGLRVSHDLIPSRLPHGVQNTSLTWSGMESMTNAEYTSMHASGTEPSTSVFRSTPRQ